MASVFLSYDRDDGVKAGAVAKALQKFGHSVWWDRHIRGGSEFNKEIEEALARADAVVVLWSEQSIDSAWVRDEAAAGRDSGRLVPARLDGSLPPLGFRQFQTIDLGSGPVRAGSEAVKALLGAIDGLAASTPGQPMPDRHDMPPIRKTGISRRAVGAGLLVLGAAGGAGYWLLGSRQAPANPEVEALLAQAWTAWTQGTPDGSNQAIGLYRRATELDPNNADAWGFLACAYGDRAHFTASAERTAFRERAKAAGRRALQLDPKNAYGRAAIAYAQPVNGNWSVMEREFRRADADEPGKWLITYSLALLLTRVGRVSEAANMFGQLKGNAPTAMQYFLHVQALWAAGNLEEADRLLDEAMAIFGTHPGIWFTRFDMLLYGGRPTAALALAEDPASRPSSLSGENLAQSIALARAMADRSPASAQSVVATALGEARKSAFSAEQAIQHASGLGQVDEAFEIADAYFFSRGFAIPDHPPTQEAAPEVTLDGRDTRFLFLPSVKAMRADARFNRLLEGIGLEQYWRNAGVQPDYRSS